MSRKVVAVTVSAALMGLASLAQAAELLSPPLPTGVGGVGACHIRNAGTSPVSVQVHLFANNDPVIVFDGCNEAPLVGGHTCRVVADLPDGSYTACSVTARNVSKLRGTMEVRTYYPATGFPGGLLRVGIAEDLE